METLAQILAFSVGIVLIFGAAGKASAPKSFADSLGGIERISPSSAIFLTWSLIVSEASVGIGLLNSSGVQHYALVAAVLLLSCFLVFVTYLLVNGITLECKCFGSAGGELIGKRTMARVLLLLTAALMSLLYYVTRDADLSLEPMSARTAIELLLVSIGLVLLVRWLLLIPDLHALRRSLHSQ